MDAPINVIFHGIEKSEAIEALVRQKARKLEKHFGRLTSCRVVLEAPHRSPQKPKVFQIKIELGVPRRGSVVVCHEREGSPAHAQLPLAIRDSFEAAVRKADELSSKIARRPRLERGRRRPRPSARVLPD